VRERDYGPLAFNRSQTLVFHYAYDLPKPGLKLGKPAGWVLDNWQISGITSALSGATLPVSYSISGVSDLTGGAGNGVDTRVDIICDPNLSRGDRSPTRAFRTECIAPPSLSTNRVGTAVGDEIIGPGYLNWDITFAKYVPFGGSRRVTFRCELYNAFNNVQFSNVNTGAIFNAAGQQTNAQFGQYTAARDARRIQLTARIDF
jgi:hypothetical protein